MSTTLRTDSTNPDPEGPTFPIVVCMITRNEADRLPRSLEAVRPHVDRILVLDAESEDDTVEVARSYGADVEVRPWEGFAAARRHLLSRVDGGWILMIDADEVVDRQLWEELGELGFPDVEADGFQMRRRTVYAGRLLRRAWQPDWKTVLFRQAAARIEDQAVHESVRVEGRLRRLNSEIVHSSYRSVPEHFRRAVGYAELAADDLEARGVRAGWADLVLRPLWSWFEHLVIRGAFVDGVRGWMTAKGAAVSTYLRYAILYERQRTEDDTG